MVSNDNLIINVVETMQEKKATGIIKLNVSEVCDFTDTFIICTAITNIHSRAIADTIKEQLGEKNLCVHHIEGYKLGKWVLMDYLDFVIHIFLPKQRSYYDLERLWGDVPREEYPGEM
ncbi:MAG: ribosome silencing factor [Candidatus Stahlbacteria bacterium]|nr:MAG: ribosome silencing factor [Candidatus Stahlbacteria bacterium]